MPKYLLAHDLGTSGNKATLFTTEGELIRSLYPRLSHPLLQRQLGRTGP